MMRTGLFIALGFVAGCSWCRAAEPQSFDPIAADYLRVARPLLERYCIACHDAETKEGELDLEQMHTLVELRQEAERWPKIAEMLDQAEMPPRDSDQLAPEEKQQLRAWIERYLEAESQALAGDPGPVVLRRLSNAEYTYTIQDLTGLDLQPAREFPVDGAAGEGFTNTGNALVMSPALLTKYFDAAKGIAAHLVPLPTGVRFSPATTRRDWTNEIVAEIKRFYAGFADPEGKLPWDKYLGAAVASRDALASGAQTPSQVAAAQGLNAHYFGELVRLLNADDASPVLAGLRAAWRTAKPDDAPALVAEVARWQQALFRFQNVGHMKPWVVVVDPVVAEQELRFKFSDAADAGPITVHLVASAGGDSSEHDLVVWRRPRLVIPGRPELLLRDVRQFAGALEAHRSELFAATAACLDAAGEAAAAGQTVDVAELAARHGVAAETLSAWLDYLGLNAAPALRLDYLTQALTSTGGYDFVRGWGSPETPSIVANSTDQHIRIPGNMKGRGVCVHPSPTLNIATGWRSPLAGMIHITGQVTHAHPECGNGVTWAVELRRGSTRQTLASGVAQGGAPVPFGPLDDLAVREGDLISLVVGPRDGNHSCDLTDIELTIKAGDRTWNLSQDVSGDILASNPHADAQGQPNIWHFYTEKVDGTKAGPVIPAGSLLARWQATDKPDEKRALAGELQSLLTGAPPADKQHPDAVLYRQLASLGGPLLASAAASAAKGTPLEAPSTSGTADWGIDPALCGHRPDGSAIDAADLCLAAPTALAVRLPSDLIAGCELVATVTLDETAAEGTAQAQILPAPPGDLRALRPDTPVLARPGSAAHGRIETALAEFRNWFPAALCYSRIVPVDEVITLTLFHREEDALARLMLDDEQRAYLDRLWSELRFISQDALITVDAFGQLLEYASQDSDPRLFEPLRESIYRQADEYRQWLLATEPVQIDAVLAWAEKAYRRPLTDADRSELHNLYAQLRAEELPHDEALRLLLARVLVAPAFLYKLEAAAAGEGPAPVSDWELANRLSYFLWSSAPDEALKVDAAAGRLHDPDVLAGHARRMMRDPKVRRLATEFACQWLHIYDFASLDEKSPRHFPEFAELRDDLYEEAIQFFTDLVRRDGSVEEIWNADHVLVNETLAAFYGVPFDSGTPVPDSSWRRIDHAQQLGRGGVLGLGATLAKQSGASRTSPILRGNWVSEVLLGERLPRPPKGVPVLPEDEAALEGLTVRQLIEAHSIDPKCINCHQRIDPLGFALESYDAIGRRRERDLGNRPIDVHARLRDGTEFDGLAGLRIYLISTRHDDVIGQFCKKLLGYSLGRSVQLADRRLLADLRAQLAAGGYHMSTAIEAIVRSPQFRMIRPQQASLATATAQTSPDRPAP
ncbi:MAG: DUF1592 domain-containing protein [Pirellulales bacterium]|nr:DUF1592 domain-containing protein [Pirellulales bacterium]